MKIKNRNNIHIATTAFIETSEANLEKKNTHLFKTHIHTNIILPLYLFQYCKLILRQSALNSLFFLSCIS